jgi:hypothetical protein
MKGSAVLIHNGDFATAAINVKWCLFYSINVSCNNESDKISNVFVIFSVIFIFL